MNVPASFRRMTSSLGVYVAFMLAPPTAALSDSKTPAAAARVRVDRFGDPLPADAVQRIGSVRMRHGNRISGLVFSPDGKTLISCGSDHTIRFWDLKAGKQLRMIRSQAEVWSVALSPDGKLLASGDGEGSVMLREASSGKSIWRSAAFGSRAIAALAFSPDGKTLVGGGSDSKLRSWRVSTGEQQFVTKLHTRGVQAVAFSRDGRVLASADRNGVVHRIHLPTGRSVSKIETALNSKKVMIAFALSPDGKTVAVGGLSDAALRLITLATGKEVRRMTGRSGFISAQFSADGKQLLTGGQDGSVRLWDVATGREIRRFHGQMGWVTAAISPTGKTVVAAARNLIHVWNRESGKELFPHRGHTRMIWSVALSPDGGQLAVADYSTIRFWNPTSGRPVGRCLKHPGRGDCIVYSPTGEFLASNGLDRINRLWDPKTGKERKRFGPRNRDDGIAVSPDGKLLAAGGTDGTICIWNTATGRQVTKCAPGVMIKCVAFSPNGRLLASGSWNKSIHLWSVPEGKLVRKLDGHIGSIFSVAFSPDGTSLASCGCTSRFISGNGKDPLIRLWKVADGTQYDQLGGSPNGYYQVKYSRDGRTLAGAGADGLIRLWETSTGRERCVLKGHTGPVLSIDLSNNGRTIVSGSADTTALVWDASGLSGRRSLTSSRLQQRWKQLWSDLAGADAQIAYRAQWSLESAGDEAATLLAQHLKPRAAIKKQRLQKLISALNAEKFAERETAERELHSLGHPAVGALRNALKSQPGAEMRTRIIKLLKKLTTATPPPERLREIRSVELLEHIGTPTAQKVLRALAKGDPNAILTVHAAAAVRRTAAP